MIKAVFVASTFALATAQNLEDDGLWYVAPNPYVYRCNPNVLQIDVAAMNFTVAADGHLVMDGATTSQAPPDDQIQMRSTALYTPGSPVTMTYSLSSSECAVTATLTTPGAATGPSVSFTLTLAFGGNCAAVCPDAANVPITADFVCTSCTRAPTPLPVPIAGRKLLQPPFAYDCGIDQTDRVYVDVEGVDITTVDGSAITVTTFPETAGRDQYTFQGDVDTTGYLDVRYNISIYEGATLMCAGDVILTGQERPWPRVNDQFGIMDINFQVNFEDGLCTFVCTSQDVTAMLYADGQPIPTYAPTAATDAPTVAPTKKPKTMSGGARSGAAAWVAALMVAAVMAHQ